MVSFKNIITLDVDDVTFSSLCSLYTVLYDDVRCFSFNKFRPFPDVYCQSSSSYSDVAMALWGCPKDCKPAYKGVYVDGVDQFNKTFTFFTEESPAIQIARSFGCDSVIRYASDEILSSNKEYVPKLSCGEVKFFVARDDDEQMILIEDYKYMVREGEAELFARQVWGAPSIQKESNKREYYKKRFGL